MKTLRCLSATLLLLPGLSLPLAAAELEPLLATLRAVGPKGAGNLQAAGAWEQLSRVEAAQLPEILAAIDGAGPLGTNWIRAAVDAIAERELRGGGTLPAAELERFVRDTGGASRARRLAYEWLRRVDASAPKRLLPGMLDDPSLELRRDAVARLIARASDLEGDRQAAAFGRALSAARDPDQINSLAQRLRKLGKEVDLPRHFGFLLPWKLIGPFDNTGEQAYDKVYPPERKIDFQAACRGKDGEIKWIDHVTSHEYGQVDFNKVLGEQKDVIAYATTGFLSEKQQQVEFRITTFNAVKLWVNGQLVDEHNVYHGGSQMDQYVSRAELKPGRNVILVKVCQNTQPQEWARRWWFQLRVCDRVGTAILSSDREP